MFEKSALREETKKVRGMLDKALYPETYAALSDVFINEDTPFIIASNLMECDKPKDLPPFVIEYITALYEIEISEGNHHAMKSRHCTRSRFLKETITP